VDLMRFILGSFQIWKFLYFELFHNHPINSSQAKQINENLKQKEKKERKDAWRTMELKKGFVGTTRKKTT
jgi:hypothetical protein